MIKTVYGPPQADAERIEAAGTGKGELHHGRGAGNPAGKGSLLILQAVYRSHKGE